MLLADQVLHHSCNDFDVFRNIGKAVQHLLLFDWCHARRSSLAIRQTLRCQPHLVLSSSAGVDYATGFNTTLYASAHNAGLGKRL
jgi:hypothetical protein